MPEKAIQYWRRAGRRAAERSAYVEAIEHLKKGLSLLESHPDNTNRLRYELIFQIGLGQAFTVIKGHGASETEEAFLRAKELCQKVGEPAQIFDAALGLRRIYFSRARFKKTKEFSIQLLDIAHELQDSNYFVEAHRFNGSTCFCMGDFKSAKEHLDKALFFYNREKHYQHAIIYGMDPAVASLNWNSWTLWVLGFPDQALSTNQEALGHAKTLSHAYSQAMTLSFFPFLHQFRGEVQKTKERAESVVAFSNEQRFPFWAARGTVLLGWSLAKQGQVAEGIKKIRQGIDLCLSTSGELNLPYYLSLMAESYRMLGQPKKGLSITQEALTLLDKTEERFWEAELIRQKGELLIDQSKDNHSEAESCFQQALEVARRQQAKSLELRATMSLSRLWQNQGKKEEARNILSEIYGWFTEGFQTADLKDAKALIEELS